MDSPEECSDATDRLASLKLAEQAVREAAGVLRRLAGAGNLTIRMPDSGDIVAILHCSEQEADDLESLLRR